MSLDVYLTEDQDEEGKTTIYERNITHNLGAMAKEAGIYLHLWHPEEIGITKAEQLIEPLREGLTLLKSDPDRFKQFDPPNKWGNYDGLVKFVREYLSACEANPNSSIDVSR